MNSEFNKLIEESGKYEIIQRFINKFVYTTDTDSKMDHILNASVDDWLYTTTLIEPAEGTTLDS